MSSPQELPYGTSIGSGSNADDWATAILNGLGAPLTSANIDSLVDWMDQEGGGGQNNPLNITVASEGNEGTIGDAAGVVNIATPADGVADTVAFLEQSGYSSIVAALKSGEGLIGNTSSAIASELSAWSGGGYSSISGNANEPAGKGGTSSSSSSSSTTPLTESSTQAQVPGPIPSDTGAGWSFSSLLHDISGLFRDIATVLDYIFGMFGRGQGWRLAFTIIFAAAMYGAYRALVAAGAIPDMGKASVPAVV